MENSDTCTITNVFIYYLRKKYNLEIFFTTGVLKFKYFIIWNLVLSHIITKLHSKKYINNTECLFKDWFHYLKLIFINDSTIIKKMLNI